MITFKRDKNGFEFEFYIYPKCWWLNHNYAKWSSVYNDYNDQQYQFRKCIDCGKIDKRKVGWLINLPIEAINKEIE